MSARTSWTCAWCGHENGHDGVMCDECHHYGQPPQRRTPEELAAVAWGPGWSSNDRKGERAAALTELRDRLTEAETRGPRLLFIAEHLFDMIPQQAWRDTGGDDGQGHYEGDYRAEQMLVELREHRAYFDKWGRDA